MVEYHPISSKDISRLHQFGPKVLPGIFLGYVLYARRIWKGDIMVADSEKIRGNGHIWTPRQKAPCKGSVNAQKWWRDHPDRGEERGNLLGESDGSSPPFQDPSPDDGEARNHFFSISSYFIYRHHVEPRVKLYVPREESFPIPLRYIDVTRETSTTLDVMWCLSAAWKIIGKRKETETCQVREQGSHDVPYWTKNLQRNICNDKKSKQLPGQITCGQNYGKTWQKRRNEGKNSGPWRNRRFTMLEDCAVFTSLIQRMWSSKKHSKRAEKLEVPMPAAMPRKIRRGMCKETCRNPDTPKDKNTHATLKPTDLRTSVWKEPYTKIMKCILQGKESIHYSTTIRFTSLFLCLKECKIPDAKAAVGTEWENSRKYRLGSWRKSETKKRWSMKQGKKATPCTSRHEWASVISRIRSWNPNFSSTKAG